MQRVPIGKFFVWTKGGHRPRHSHKTRASALKEAKRLAALNPGKRYIVQEFHEKVFVDVEASPTTDGKQVTRWSKLWKLARKRFGPVS
jgi:hypothetical protein